MFLSAPENDHMKQFLQKIIDYGLLVTVFVFPLFINIAFISPEDPGHPLIAVNVSLADLFIGIVLLLWISKVLICKKWKQIKLPEVSILIFVGTGALSFVNAFSIIQWLKELIQLLEYFLLFYVLLINNLQTIRLATLKSILFVSTSIILAMGLIQHTFLHGDPYFVRGFFENRNILGTFLCMVIPLVYIELLSSGKRIQKIWMGALLFCSYLVLLSGSAALSILISLLILSWSYSKKVFVRFLVISLSLAVSYPFIMPSKNIRSMKEFASIYEQGSISENYYRRLTLLGDLDKTILIKKDIGNNCLLITSEKFLSVKMPEIRKGERYKDMEGEKHIKNRYLEIQASLNLVSKNTLLGVGLGNYQDNIGTCYNDLPKVNTAEPNQHNGYLIIASTTGLFGLSALLGLFFFMLGNAWKRSRSSREDQYWHLGLMGSILACMIENLFSYLFVATLLVPFIFIVYLIFRENIKTCSK
jgi:O-antigen ligase